MHEEINIDSVSHLNDCYGFTHLHPLITIGHYEGEAVPGEYVYHYGIYAIYIKETKGCVLNYGLTKYDFDEMSVVAFAPGQKVKAIIEPGSVQPRWTVLAFHPDLLARTVLGKKMSSYGFFSYNSNEALHLSAEEVTVMNSVMSLIEREMHHALDRHSRSIIVANIEVFLDYCLRFYERQFITREEINSSVVEKFQLMLADYMAVEAGRQGMPTVAYFADKLNLSQGYFGELVKSATGMTAKDIIADNMVNTARELLNDMNLSVTQVGYRLGFEYPQHFVRFFKRKTGKTPGEYRNVAN